MWERPWEESQFLNVILVKPAINKSASGAGNQTRVSWVDEEGRDMSLCVYTRIGLGLIDKDALQDENWQSIASWEAICLC